ncbi:type II toxin-antitoxin system PemK/MazF family toxin [Carnobacterium maltaromaticum]|jgi:mRNA interferase MazF|uniref:Transcriptional modulator of MazE/toxin, MazF n=1 Tax=Carnobacterium maltaromaticum TaxID=2751 RepID=A0A1Z5AYR2_CARML|nr:MULTISPECIES: type II toxin-antitoxin system PemK/MazF family toxin [Carnobacterium]KRN69304.1 hypothetical protein IV70_GL000591 [Carnobacterium maltaromaticum DSM 20342]KRN87163.1 hypothetical protein IV75_GL000350 [Carnobacterium maltaromaticum]MDT1946532.1 type II toxin-antitoxin system PemK/MazF family toxin [Carnobacterium maltaromaticum]MDT2000899.1 type II toxin-antitoxin system PemK/MazF family toxin [Carnobacterium maltaromaticum]TFJ25688.1 type II toxin-antitoxin system PemK/MazF
MVGKYIPKQGDIILVNFDPSLGHEQKDQRPALVVSANLLSKTSPFTWVVPISNGKWNYPTHVVLDDRTKTSGQLFVEQLMTIDYRVRPLKYLEKIPNDILDTVLNTIHELTKKVNE